MADSFPLIPIDVAAGVGYSDYLGTRCRVVATGSIDGQKRRWPTALIVVERREDGQLESGYLGKHQGLDDVHSFLKRRGWDTDLSRDLTQVLRGRESPVRRPVYPSGANASKAAGGWAFRLMDPVGVILEEFLVLPLGGAPTSWLDRLRRARWVLVYLMCGVDDVYSYDLETTISSAMSDGRRLTLGATLPVVRKRRESEWRIRIEPDPWL